MVYKIDNYEFVKTLQRINLLSLTPSVLGQNWICFFVFFFYFSTVKFMVAMSFL